MVAHTFNPTTLEADTGGSQVEFKASQDYTEKPSLEAKQVTDSKSSGWLWCSIVAIPAFIRLLQENGEFVVSLGYRESIS